MGTTGAQGGRRVGRPRADQRPDSGLSPRAELLSAAAELFTTRGYAATTTRAVAERAGMRQASMYHYVSGKEELLADLLESTVTPSLAYARELLADDATPAEGRLWELCRTDVELLCGGSHNLGGLYLLPEVRAERFMRLPCRTRRTQGRLPAVARRDGRRWGACEERVGAADGSGVRAHRGRHPGAPLRPRAAGVRLRGGDGRRRAAHRRKLIRNGCFTRYGE